MEIMLNLWWYTRIAKEQEEVDSRPMAISLEVQTAIAAKSMAPITYVWVKNYIQHKYTTHKDKIDKIIFDYNS